MIEIAESVRIVQSAMFTEALPIVAALNAVHHAIATHVSGINQFAVLIEVQTPGVAAAFAKKIEATGKRMIAPDALLELKATDTRGDGASLAAVEPTVGSPGKRVCDRMGVLHAKTGEENFGVGIGHIIGIAVRIK